LPCRAHGVVLEASVPIAYLLGRLSIAFSLLSTVRSFGLSTLQKQQ